MTAGKSLCCLHATAYSAQVQSLEIANAHKQRSDKCGKDYVSSARRQTFERSQYCKLSFGPVNDRSTTGPRVTNKPSLLTPFEPGLLESSVQDALTAAPLRVPYFTGTLLRDVNGPLCYLSTASQKLHDM